MSTSTVIEIADSVVAKLNSSELALQFQAERLYVPNFDLEEMKQLRVTVVPRDVDITPLDRAHNRCHYRVDVAIQKKFTKGTNDEIDPLVAFVESICDLFRMKRLESFPAARCVKVEHAVLYSSEHWEQFRQFTSLLTLTFELAR